VSKTRILVVDDSVVVRRLLTDLLSQEESCEVVGVVANGKIALAKIPQVNPDLVTLDVEMPEMDGLETLAAIRKIYPKLPVIMFSALTERAADATLKALALGATDYVTKPTTTAGKDPMAQVREQLMPKIRWLAAARAEQRAVTYAAARPVPSLAPWVAKRVGGAPAPAVVQGGRVEVLAIGCSTGGPNALAALLPMLPADLSVPVMITQHMPPLFTRLLAERLNAAGPLKVREACAGDLVEPGHIYVAPGDYHMDVRRDGTVVRIVLHQSPQENSCRPAVDVMLRSIVRVYGAGTLAVILTGMGQDGLRGCELVRETGGRVLAQDEASSVVWGMPGAVAKAGHANAVIPITAMATEITRHLGAVHKGAPITRCASVGS